MADPVPIRLPLEGVADRTPLRKTPPMTAPPGQSMNVVARRSKTGRVQLTKRPGWRKTFKQRFGTGPIQGIKSIARASAVTSFQIGDSTPLTDANGISRLSIRHDANGWIIPLAGTDSRGIRDTVKIYGSAGACLVRSGGQKTATTVSGVSGFPTSPTPWAAVVHPNGTLGAVLVNFTDTTAKTLIAFVDPTTGAYLASKLLVGADIAASAVVWTNQALWIAKGAILHYIPTPVSAGVATVDSSTSLTVAQAPGSASGALTAASSITGLCQYVDAAGDTYLYACFQGATAAGSCANPPGLITTGGYAKHFRAGIYRLKEVQPIPLTFDYQVMPFGGDPSSGDPYVELTGTVPVLHSTVRFSQFLDRSPRGCLPTAIACNSDGAVAVTFTNQGYGPNVAFQPDGSRPYTTVAKFDPAGLLLWEADGASNVGGEAGGKLASVSGTFPTDIPDEDGGNAGTTSKNGPAIRAVDIDSFGDVYVGGRLNNGPAHIFAFQSGSGNPKWTKSVTDPAQVAGATGYGTPALGIRVVDGSVLVIATRTNLWDPSTGSEAYAGLWRLSPVDGALEWSFGITQQAAGTPPDNDPTFTCLGGNQSVILLGSALFTDAP